jgi:hypothetical protein
MWQAMSKSASLHLETVYDQLCKERSPQERIIQRDLARTFPRIDMFKQENGQGQSSMKRILEAYSLYDTDVGYCQGLAFLVGPLLMNVKLTSAFFFSLIYNSTKNLLFIYLFCADDRDTIVLCIY